ncbi:succinate dehydrogenase/fumarate reductase iron-sulfur subunit [Candidatus Uabimicrobium amorphum]|uniref:Fumarate reductase iron-sulfur subunit n=1 Tax=Uabimicrobium amorphum TaxID=2596890 RepID=A0A5S9INF6_UABAM|nr:succinate dehydrogenase/fumarate reductase iron-sulfur subunit [Candidatus Uabimicrobium amorphum]BBM83775.1 succinate dehydrogenase [Candidatus Uabimicrobium amorphum]
MSETINVTIKVWRQKDKDSKGEFQTYEAKDISTHMSFLEMLDEVNDVLIKDGKEPIAFDHDCREGICGSCSMVINGRAHGPEGGITACQLHMRKFKNGDTIYIEPWRAKAFPVLKDLVVDRTAFDRIMTAGGYVSVKTGGAPDGNAIPIPKQNAELAMDAAACIGCGACVAACKNASAMLFVSAKVSQYALLPQGQAESATRVKNMLAQMEKEGFGNCTNSGQCEAECPKEISISNIARLNRELIKASVTS